VLVEYCERDNLVYWKLSVNLFLCYLCFLLKSWSLCYLQFFKWHSYTVWIMTTDIYNKCNCAIWILATLHLLSWTPSLLTNSFCTRVLKNIFRRLLLVSIVPYCTKLWYPCSIIWHHMFAVLLLCNSWKAGP